MGTSIFQGLSIQHPPLRGNVFSSETLSQGLRYVREGKVRLVTSNINGSFAGLFGVVKSFDDGPSSEVSLVVQRGQNGTYTVDGSDSAGRRRNSDRVAALLIAAMEATQGITAEIPLSLTLSREDVRGGILEWDAQDDMAQLGRMRLARIQGYDHSLETLLRERGMLRLVELYPWDEIASEYRECYVVPAGSVAEQEMKWAEFLANATDALQDLGCRIDTEDSFGLQVILPNDWFGGITEADGGNSIDWFDFEYGIRIGRERINILPCLADFLRSRNTGFRLGDLSQMTSTKRIPLKLGGTGNYAAIQAGKLHTILTILSELWDDDAFEDDGSLRVHRVRAAQIASGVGSNRFVDQAPEYLLRTAEDISALSPRSTEPLNHEFLASLRPYQEDGFRWLQFLREQKLGGVLADDMGLGKTVQTLCHLLHEKKSGRADLPILIVAPKSVVPNWAKEAKKFAPSLTVLELQGDKRRKYYSVLHHCDLVVTSYPVLLKDADDLLRQQFHYVVLDEAHAIKNSGSQVTKILHRINARHRLCLTGTPIENHLGELWSIFQFLMPGYLGSEESFTQVFRHPIEKDRDEARRQQLAQRVAPLMLRRTKTLVAHDLPSKTEIVRTIELNAKQVELYEAVRASVCREIGEEIARHGIERSKILILDALLKLRQICCHPQLLRLESAKKAKRSAKLDFLLELIEPMVEEGRKILIFSQFSSMLDLIQTALNDLGIDSILLNGQTPERGALCDKFQSGVVPVFLISLRAGGTGLNLTAADTVIHYDPWWNPALESQATDRAYRIGQKNPVFVYKFISQGTIEEKILLLQKKKRALFQGILEGVPQKLEFSEDELRDLLSPVRESGAC